MSVPFLRILHPLPGPTVDDLATALAMVPGLNGTTPTAVTLGGYQGKQLTLTAPADFTRCTLAPGSRYRVWELPLGASMDMPANAVVRAWILDVAGTRLVVDVLELRGESAQTKAEVQTILDSIRLAPHGGRSSQGRRQALTTSPLTMPSPSSGRAPSGGLRLPRRPTGSGRSLRGDDVGGA